MLLSCGVGRLFVESPLDCKEIQSVLSKGDQSCVFIGRTYVEAEIPILWPPDAKSWLIWKDLDAGKDWGQEEKGMTEDEMVGWHHWLNGHGFGLTPGVGDGQGGLACCGWWGHKELDMIVWLNWTNSHTGDMIRKRKNIIGCILLIWGRFDGALPEQESVVFKRFTGIVVLWFWSLSHHVPLL